MIYAPQEYEYWEYISYIHKESSLRDLTGKKAYGLHQSGSVGSQDPSQIEFNIAIPSRTEREKNRRYRPVEMKPGCIRESLAALKQENIKELNISIDEKHISSGIQ